MRINPLTENEVRFVLFARDMEGDQVIRCVEALNPTILQTHAPRN